MLGVIAFGVSYIGLARGSETLGLLLAWFLAAGIGIGIGLVETAQHATVASLAPPDVRGSTFGVLAAVQSFGNLAASAIAGILWTTISPRAAFVYLAATMIAALVLLARSREAG